MTELCGIGQRFSTYGRPERLTGRAKLDADVAVIVRRVVMEQGVLRVSSAEIDRGVLATAVHDALVDPANWWAGEYAVIVRYGEVSVNVSALRPESGVLVVPFGAAGGSYGI